MNQKELAKRRRQLMRMMGEASIALIPAAPVRIRNRDVEYHYRQDSDFLYLTGFEEPEALAVLVPGRSHGEFLLFCRERDPVMETWHGRRAGQEGVVERYGADDSFPIADVDEIVPGLLEHCGSVYYTMGRYPEWDQRVVGWVNQIRSQSRAGVHAPTEFISLDHMIHDMRLYKSRAETKVMRRAAQVAIDAHRRAMAACRPGIMEYEVQAELVYEFTRHGARSAYPPIVGGGANGCILHYTENDAPLNEGELLLIDAGAEVEGYASDITRTFPINGRFSPAQREVYELVLSAQQAAIRKIKPGNHWNDPHDTAVRVLTKGLVELGLLKGQPAKLIRDGEFRRFYMHRTGHWLGLDVHDVGDYKIDEQWRLLEPGMVMTVEPGLYIPARSKGVTRRWWDIGVRIEDDVLVTRDGCEVLTGALPSDPDTIEAMVGA